MVPATLVVSTLVRVFLTFAAVVRASDDEVCFVRAKRPADRANSDIVAICIYTEYITRNDTPTTRPTTLIGEIHPHEEHGEQTFRATIQTQPQDINCAHSCTSCSSRCRCYITCVCCTHIACRLSLLNMRTSYAQRTNRSTSLSICVHCVGCDRKEQCTRTYSCVTTLTRYAAPSNNIVRRLTRAIDASFMCNARYTRAMLSST